MMKKILLGIATVFALTTVGVQARAEEGGEKPAGDAKAKKKGKKKDKKAEEEKK